MYNANKMNELFFTELDKKNIGLILKRFVTCLNSNGFVNLTNYKFDAFDVKEIQCSNYNNVNNSVFLVEKDIEEYKNIISNNKNNIVVKLTNKSDYKNSYYLSYPKTNLKVEFYGAFFEMSNIIVPDEFRVLAIIHFYNEEDVIERTVRHLLNQGIDVYLFDNWSKDNSLKIVNDIKKEYPDRVFIDKYPSDKDNGCYEWAKQLEMTEQISKNTKYDWYIHHDVDEYRISPWKNVTLKQFIYCADCLGYNLIESNLACFRLTDKKQNDIFMNDTYFEVLTTSGALLQKKIWKKNDFINLKHSGGHDVEIDEEMLFPLKILNRHYPFRTFEQAKRKVFTERKNRFVEEEKKIGWHVQYDSIVNSDDLISDKNNLILWDDNTMNYYFIKLFIDAHI